MNARLAAKVDAVNRANHLAREIHSKLAQYFAPMVGSSVVKVSGELLFKIQQNLPLLPYDTRTHITRLYFPRDYLVWSVIVSETIAGTNGMMTSYEVLIHVGKLDDTILTGILDPQDRRTDYTVDEIENLWNQCEIAKKQYQAAKNALLPFSESDIF